MQEGSAKYPIRFTLKSSNLFSFAGLWDKWKDPKGTEVRSFTIITTDSKPNELIRKYHDRMPVIVSEEAEDEWLMGEENPTNLIEKILKQSNSISLEGQRVSTLVNSPRNDSEAVLK